MLVLLICIFLFFIPSTLSTIITTNTSCNGHPSYCSQLYSNLTFLASHDSPFTGSLPQDNQNLNITQQLDLGIRFIQAQTHRPALQPNSATLHVCHTSCLLEDGGTLENFLGTVKSWLDKHPEEVVTLLLTNGDNVDVSLFGEAFEKSGLDKDVFVPEGNKMVEMDKWPTLGNLIQDERRVVVFLDYGANTTKTPYVLDEFAYFFETPYDVTNASFPDCSINRPPGASATGRMYIVNHFLDVDILGVLIPDRKHAATTNALMGNGSIGAQSSLCQSLYGRKPNAVLLDFVDQGEAMRAQNVLNGIS